VNAAAVASYCTVVVVARAAVNWRESWAGAAWESKQPSAKTQQNRVWKNHRNQKSGSWAKGRHCQAKNSAKSACAAKAKTTFWPRQQSREDERASPDSDGRGRAALPAQAAEAAALTFQFQSFSSNTNYIARSLRWKNADKSKTNSKTVMGQRGE